MKRLQSRTPSLWGNCLCGAELDRPWSLTQTHQPRAVLLFRHASRRARSWLCNLSARAEHLKVLHRFGFSMLKGATMCMELDFGL